MTRCMGICSECGKCKNSEMLKGANERKAKMIQYPSDFCMNVDRKGYGVAFDIGTTTVVGMLWDLSRGKQINVYAETNPQNEMGMDVISRITYCADDEKKLILLQEKIINCLNDIIKRFCTEENIAGCDIHKIIVCGNTTMSHIFAGYSPHSLAISPFTPAYTGTLTLTAADLRLNIDPEGEIVVVPNIAGHIGGDITAGLVATRFLKQQKLTLFIDIGTNGEMALTDGKRTVVCSTAAGPAFEGAFISYGMRAADGAIEKVMVHDEGMLIKTIGDEEPQGICGSGLIDLLAIMTKENLINRKGRLADIKEASKRGVDEKLSSLLFEENGQRCFQIAQKKDRTIIYINQNDIREVQLAKGAILAGIRTMLKAFDKSENDIDEILLAGAFGNYIDKTNAIKIGLLPNIDPIKIRYVGNTAGIGVSMILGSDKELEQAQELPYKIEHLELAKNAEFQEEYLKAMYF